MPGFSCPTNAYADAGFSSTRAPKCSRVNVFFNLSFVQYGEGLQSLCIKEACHHPESDTYKNYVSKNSGGNDVPPGKKSGETPKAPTGEEEPPEAPDNADEGPEQGDEQEEEGKDEEDEAGEEEEEEVGEMEERGGKEEEENEED